MKFSNFLFPESRSPENDITIIEDSLREAVLSDQLGFDAIWLAEHHFDGGCAYVDPVTFAAAIGATTNNIKIGFAVAQMALHHPTRFAEQIALIDNITKGRIIVGVGRGTAYNFYEFRGYGVDPSEAQSRLLEFEEILVGAWTRENYKHSGKFWQIDVPVLRPKVYQSPHPPIVRACSSLESTLEMAKIGRPFLMNIQSNDVTIDRINQYRATMLDSGFTEESVQTNLSQSWIWRNVFVADTDREAEEIGIPCFRDMRAYLSDNRSRMNTKEELQRQSAATTGAARDSIDHGLIFGSPQKVYEELSKLNQTGIGGMIIHFRLGPMSWDATENSLRLFSEEVMPELQASSQS